MPRLCMFLALNSKPYLVSFEFTCDMVVEAPTRFARSTGKGDLSREIWDDDESASDEYPKLDGTLALIPAFSPEEKENRRPGLESFIDGGVVFRHGDSSFPGRRGRRRRLLH